MTLWPSGMGVADGRSFVEGNAVGGAFVRLVVSMEGSYQIKISV